MIYQTDLEFPADVYHWGCFGMCIGERVSSRFRFPFTHELMNYAFSMGVAAEYVGPQEFIKQPGQFGNLIIRKAWEKDVGCPAVEYLGHFPRYYIAASNELEIQWWHRQGTDFDHALSFEGGRLVYDPWSAEGSETRRRGECVRKSIFRVIA